MPTFAELGVSKPVVAALAKRGIETPFAIQNLVIADVLAGHDVLAQSPTGSGKTLAFGAPLVDRIAADSRRPAALILAPTRELATQITDELSDLANARALSIAPVYGGVSIDRQAKRAARAQIVVATPGRLEDLLQRRTFSLSQIQLLILDEADRMLDMGFKPAVDRIVKQCPQQRQTLFFSATLEGEAGRQARAYTNSARAHTHEPAADTTSAIEHRFVHLEHTAKVDMLVTELKETERGRTLVFVRTRRGADRLVKRLRSNSLEALAMHGDKSQSQRTRALARFEQGQVDTLIATDVAARGIDVDDVTHVIQFDAPDGRDAYVHRIGRTGRAGRTGTGISYVLPEQRSDMGKIARDLGLETEFGIVAGSQGHQRRQGSGPPSQHQRNGRSQHQRSRSRGRGNR